MDIQSILSSPFYQGALEVNSQVSSTNLLSVVFPLKSFITEGDEFFRHLWKCIDRSKDYAWVISYAFDHSIPANTTIIKLIEARKRGVHTVLFVDDLQQHIQKDLLNEYKAVGGVFLSLNSFFSQNWLKKLFSKETFRRHHEKLFVSDNCGVIGSANIESGYASTKYGSRIFKDLCFYTQNVLVEEYRNYFNKIATYYNLSLSRNHTNDNLLRKFDAAYPNSVFYRKSAYRFVRSQQPDHLEIQNEVLRRIQEAQQEITIIQPYYYPIKEFETEISNALKRGVKVELITGAKRDQPVYKWLKNGLLLRRLIKQGLKVYEMHEKILHAKAYVIDKRNITVGSFNNDRWSWRVSNEADVSIESRPDYESLLPFIQKLKVDCTRVLKRPLVSWLLHLRLSFWQKFLYLSECLMTRNKTFKINEFLFDSETNPSESEQVY